MKHEISQEVEDFLNKLFKLRWLSKKHLSEELNSFQITPAQYAALKILLDEPDGMKMSALAKQAHQVSATMTGIIDRLEMQELVQRNRLKIDRRNVSVQLTEKGRLLLDRIMVAKKAKFQDLLDQLTEDQKAQLYSTIDTAIDFFSDNFRGIS